MPDPEVGKVLTHLYGPNAGSPNPSGTHPASQFHPSNPTPPQHGPHSHQLGTPAATTTSEPTPNQPVDSPAQPGQVVKRSRQRPTKSCERCRAKKLKCDRELPCSNCKKGGRDGRDCEYRFGPNEDEGTPKAKRPRITSDKNNGQPPNNGSFRSYPTQENGSNLGSGQTVPRPSWSNYGDGIASRPDWGNRPDAVPVMNQSISSAASPLGRIEVKGTRSRYVGMGDKMAMLDHFERSKSFIVKAFKDPEISPMMQELSTFQRHYAPRHKCNPEIIIPWDREELMAEMLKALPSGYLFGVLKAKYISNWETVTRILHIPTFMRECDEVQAAREAEPMTSLPSHIPIWIVPQILAVIATGSRLRDPSERSVSGEELADEAITKNCLMVQRWLDDLHGKITLNFPILQTRALLLLARQSNLSHPSELCRRSGDLVRVAMTMGLHKDPEEVTEITKSQKEMRRKIWYTIVELDLQFALACGMPTSITSSAFNVRTPLNVDDQELSDDIETYPHSKSDDTWTSALPQITTISSLRSRLNATNLLGSCLNLSVDAPILLSHAKILEQALRSLPSQFLSSTPAGNKNNKHTSRLFTSIMLDMSLRRPLLSLYRSISQSPHSTHYPEAQRGALRCSLAILSHLDALDPEVADLATVKSRDYLNLFHLLCKNEILTSAILLCQEIRSFSTSPTSSQGNEPFPQTKHSLTRVVENTLNSILSRLGDFGSDLKDVLPLSVVLQSVRLGSEGSEKEVRDSMVRGAERVLAACRKVMPSIEDAALLNSVARGNEGHSQQTQHHNILPPPNSTWYGGLDPAMATPGQPYAGYGGNQTFGDFNVVPGDQLSFADFDLGFGFTDWDLNQYWL